MDLSLEEEKYQELFINDRSKNFVGRQDILENIIAYLQQSHNKPLMIIGPPGIGKSALLAKFTQLYRKKFPQFLIIPHFIGASPESTDVFLMLQRLIREIKKALGEKDTTAATDFNELAEEFSISLQKLNTRQTTVLVIDALNQCREHNLFWLPEKLPDNVHFIFSTLPGSIAEAQRRNIETITLSPLLDNEIQTLIANNLAQHSEEFDYEQYISILSTKSQGIPLYLQIVLKQLSTTQDWQRVKKQIEGFPGNITELFRELFLNLENQETQDIPTVLSLLAAAREGLYKDELEEILLDRYKESNSKRTLQKHCAQVITLLTPYLLPYHSKSKTKLNFFHQQMQFAANDYYLKFNHQSTHSKLANYFAQKGYGNFRTLSEYTYHLLESGNKQKLYDLFIEEDLFIKKQVQHFHNYNKSYESLKHGLQAYITGDTPENDLQLCKLALKAAEVSEQAKNSIEIAFEWAKQGKIKKSLSMLEVLDHVEFYKACILLLWIEANRQKKLPQEKKTKIVANQILDAIKCCVPKIKQPSYFLDIEFMDWWAYEIFEIADFEELRKIFYPGLGFVELAENLALSGRIQESIAILEKLEDSWYGFSKIAKILFEQNAKKAMDLFDKSLKIAENINSPKEKTKALITIAIQLARCKQKERALEISLQAQKTGEELEDEYAKFCITIDYMRVLVLTNKIELALRVLDSCIEQLSFLIIQEREDYWRDLRGFMAPLLCEKVGLLVYELYTAGNKKEAFSLLQILENNDSGRVVAVETLAKLGEFVLAFDVLPEQDSLYDIALSFISMSMADEEMISESVEVVDMLYYTQTKSETLAYIGYITLKKGQREKAITFFEQVIDLIKNLDLPDMPRRDISKIAFYLFKEKEYEKAIEFFQYILHKPENKLESEYKKPTSLSSIVEAFIEVKDLEKALYSNEFINKESYYYIHGISQIALAMHKKGEQNKARELILQTLELEEKSYSLDWVPAIFAHFSEQEFNNILQKSLAALDDGLALDKYSNKRQNERSRVFILEEVIKPLVNSGKLRKAMELIDSVKDPIFKDMLLLEFIRGLVEESHFDKSFEILEKMEDCSTDKAIALGVIAQALAKNGNKNKAVKTFQRFFELVSIHYDTERYNIKRVLFEVAKIGIFKINNFDEVIAKIEKIASIAGEIAVCCDISPCDWQKQVIVASFKSQLGVQDEALKTTRGVLQAYPFLHDHFTHFNELDLITNILAKNNEIAIFSDFLTNKLLPYSTVVESIKIYRKSFLKHTKSSLNAIRQSLTFFPFDKSLALDDINALQIAHIHQKNWDHHQVIWDYVYKTNGK